MCRERRLGPALRDQKADEQPDAEHARTERERERPEEVVVGEVVRDRPGRLGDMYGKERLLVLVLALLCVGTLVTAIAGRSR